jgi:Domain of unknown function (DUF4382)
MRLLVLLGVCALTGVITGCHRNNLTSGYGIGFVTLTSDPGDFSRYVVTVDGVTLVGKTYGAITAVSLPEVVDLTKLKDLSELWDSASIPNDTYTSAVITLDYSLADIDVIVGGVPQKATVVDSTGATAGQVAVTIYFDPTKQLTVQPTYASTDAQRLAFTFDMALSNSINSATNPATVTVKPYFTVATSAPDTKPVRVRGPLVNSSVNLQTYSVYVRPFDDPATIAGSLTMFNGANTVYNIDGSTFVGEAGIQRLSQTSSGSTMTSAITTYQPTPTTIPAITAAKFNTIYIVAGTSLEDIYSTGVEGEVIARSGNTLTVRNVTLTDPGGAIVNALGSYSGLYTNVDQKVTIGPATVVTADGVANQAGLNYNSIGVGQHIRARVFRFQDIYTPDANGLYPLDATGAQTGTGSVRLLNTELWGTLVSDTTGSLVLDLLSIDRFPASVYNFAGNGTSAATDSQAANYVVNTAAATLPATAPAVGDPLWINGLTSGFGAAPPDFNATSVTNESAETAVMVVSWTGTGTATPFSGLDGTGLTVDLTNGAFASGVIVIGPERTDITTLPASPHVVPSATPAVPTDGTPNVYLPLYALGSTAVGVSVYNNYNTFVSETQTNLAAFPVVKMTARGTYDRVNNVFTAVTINLFN